MELRYDQFGWKDDDSRFLVGKRLYTPTSIIHASGNPTLENRAQFLGPSKAKGASLDRWQRAANKMFAAGMEHQSLAILCGFAAPLMRFHAAGEGGAIVSFVSDLSGTGKTSALEAAASIWGDHKGVKLDETDTRVAKGLKLGILGNLPCTFDELHERDPELIRQFVLIFTNGSDKDRGTADGGLRINKSDWQTILLTASNTSLVDILSNMDASNAPAARILEFNVSLPEHMGKDDFDAIRRELSYNHGFAGEEFMKKLVQPEVVSWIKQNIPAWSASVRKAAGLTDVHRFWVRLIVSVIAAGTIVEKMGLLEFSMERITKWLLDYVSKGSNTLKPSLGAEPASALGLFINDHKLDIMTVTGAYRSGKRSAVLLPPARKLLGRYEQENKRLYVSDVTLRKWLVKSGISVRGFVDKLVADKVMTPIPRKVTLGAGTDFASGQVPCYSIDMSHPSVAGAVTEIVVDVPPPHETTKHAQRVLEFKR